MNRKKGYSGLSVRAYVGGDDDDDARVNLFSVDESKFLASVLYTSLLVTLHDM